MIWIVGSKGMLGTELAKTLEQTGIAYHGSDRELDIRDLALLTTFVEATFGKSTESSLRWIVNCSAYTAVDKAEDEYELAKSINADGVANLATLANKLDVPLLHLSTDYVFDGEGIKGVDGQLRAYQEHDPIAPQGAYGKTKSMGEQVLRSICPKHVILRTAWLYGEYGPNFVSTMLRLMAERENLGVVADQWGAPSWAADLAQAIVAVIRHPLPSWGTFHASGEGCCSWYDFACEIQNQALELGILIKKATINSLSSEQYPTKTKRPAWSVLDKSKLAADYGFVFPDWQSSLIAYLKSIVK